MKYLFILSLLFLVSCSKNKSEDDNYSLALSGEYLSFPIDEDTKLPNLSVYSFVDSGIEYLSFQNGSFQKRNEIQIYEIRSGKLVKKVNIAGEGKDAVPGGFLGYYMESFDEIIIPSSYSQILYVVDTAAVVKRKILFDDDPSFCPVITNSALKLTFIKDTLYLPQLVNTYWKKEMMNKSRICFTIDTLSGNKYLLPMGFPPLISHKDIGTSAGFGAHYSNAFDGTHFVYSFFFNDKIYRTTSSHERIEEIKINSRYIHDVEVIRVKSADMNDVIKAMCEYPTYGNIVYDKYREVFYQFAFPKSEIDVKDDPSQLYSSGRSLFSIIILDRELNILGETLFPECTYNPNLYIVLEDGLFLSTNHIKSPAYDDDMLTFEKIVLTSN